MILLCNRFMTIFLQMENLAAYVIDSCIFNLLSEVSYEEETIF